MMKVVVLLSILFAANLQAKEANHSASNPSVKDETARYYDSRDFQVSGSLEGAISRTLKRIEKSNKARIQILKQGPKEWLFQVFVSKNLISGYEFSVDGSSRDTTFRHVVKLLVQEEGKKSVVRLFSGMNHAEITAKGLKSSDFFAALKSEVALLKNVEK